MNNMDKVYILKKILNRLLCILLIMLIIISSIYIIKYYKNVYTTKKESYLLDEIYISKDITHEKDEHTLDHETEIPIAEKTERMLKLEELQKENSDIIGWIEIENTDINYPVLQGEDNDYYMNHNYKKEYSMNGSIFLDKDYNWNPPSSNLLIYGHNMKNSTMFQTLLKYRDITYYEDHPIIRFTTNLEDSNYEIISAFNSRVYYKSEQDVFRYYYFIDAKDEEEYNEFVENAINASLYDTNKTAVYGEQLMTLSTCSYHVKDGRFVVVAKKMQ